MSGQKRLDPVELFEQHQKGELVLEREPGQGQNPVGSRKNRVAVTFGTPNQKSDPLFPSVHPRPVALSEGLGRRQISPLVKNDPKRTLTLAQHRGLVPNGDKGNFCIPPQPFCIFIDTLPNETQPGLADRENLHFH